MRQSIFFILFLALAMTVMSAPAKTKGKRCVPGGIKAGPAKAAPAKVAPAKAAPPAKAAAPVKRLGKRAETSLCGIPIRGGSASMCQGNPGYFKDDKTKLSAWTPWDNFKAKITSANVPSRYQCDHAIELQLTVKALTDAKFCVAFNEMQAAWTKYDPKANAAAVMRTVFQSILKPSANAPNMLFYIDTKFNGDKRAWVANFLASRAPPATPELKGYFAPDKKAIADGVAAAIDRAAGDTLSEINKRATAGINIDNPTDAQNTLICALDKAELETYKGNGPVKALWTKMKALV